MAKKKTENNPPIEEAQEGKNVKKKSPAGNKSNAGAESTVQAEEKTEKKQREPQLVTVNGDKVSHAHWYKPEGSEQLYFTAKLNGVPLKPQRMTSEDADAVLNKTKTLGDLFAKYYPSKMEQRVSNDAYKFPQKIQTSQGELNVAKFNVYKVKSTDGPYNLGQYMFYAEVDGKKMSTPASKEDLNKYFDHSRSPKDQIVKSFGDRLKLKEHYEMFQMPDNVNISDKNIRLVKNKETNEYQLQMKLADNGPITAKTLSYADTNAFFEERATKQQLVAKHFGNQLATMDLKTEQKQEVQKSMGIK